jgi:hypothetical protein
MHESNEIAVVQVRKKLRGCERRYAPLARMLQGPEV